MSSIDAEDLGELLDRLAPPVVFHTLLETDEENPNSSAPVVVAYAPGDEGSWRDVKHDLQEYWPTQRRKKGAITLRDSASFISFAVKHWDEPSSILVANSGRLVAVFNFGDRERPGWGDYRATLQLEETPEWKAWFGHQDAWLEQAEFANWLELHAADVIEPESAAVLETVLTIRLHQTATYGKGLNLRDGTIQFEYREELSERGSDGQPKITAGQTSIPASLKLRLRRYAGGFEPIDVSCLIRFRLRSGQLDFSWKFPSSVTREAEEFWRSIVAGVAAQMKQPVLWGEIS